MNKEVLVSIQTRLHDAVKAQQALPFYAFIRKAKLTAKRKELVSLYQLVEKSVNGSK